MSQDDPLLKRNQALQEMLRLARSIVADDEVSELEAKVFRAWMERHPDMHGVWPTSELVRVFRRIFADGKVTKAEREELRRLLRDVAGGETSGMSGER